MQQNEEVPDIGAMLEGRVYHTDRNCPLMMGAGMVLAPSRADVKLRRTMIFQMPHDMNNDFSERYEALRAVTDRVIDALEIYARKKYGRNFFRLARLCFPGRSADGAIRHEELFLPWAVFGWSPPSEGRDVPEECARELPSGPLALEWLRAEGADAGVLAARFVHAASHALFRFLRIEGRDNGVTVLEDMLDPGVMLRMPAREVPKALHAGDMIFCHAVTVDGITVSTHPPLDASECTRDAATRKHFEDLLGLMAAELRTSGPVRDGSGRRMLENLLFMHARYCSGLPADEAAGS